MNIKNKDIRYIPKHTPLYVGMTAKELSVQNEA